MTTTREEQKRSAVVTGAGSGLGRDIALGLAAKGYYVFGTAMSLDEIADLKKASAGAVNLGQCDITNEAAVKAWADEVTVRNEGRINLLISNAGIPDARAPGGSIAERDPARIRSQCLRCSLCCEFLSSSAAKGAGANCPSQHDDGHFAVSLQRPIRRIEGRFRRPCRRLPSGAEAFWHRCRSGCCRQHENWRASQDGRRYQASLERRNSLVRHTSSTTRSFQTVL
jgi:short chain dehydrogenase